MKETIFATINGFPISGKEIISARQRLLSEQEDNLRFSNTPNDENKAFINAEALQKLIDIQALVAYAKFEGITVEEEEVSEEIFKLRSQYEDETLWETAIEELGITSDNIRQTFYWDMMVDRFIQSHTEHFESPDNDSAEEFYEQNKTAIAIPATYSFIEVNSPHHDRVKLAATILAQDDSGEIAKELHKIGLEMDLNEEIPQHRLPEELIEVLDKLEAGKTGVMPGEDEEVILIKLLRKAQKKELSFDEAREGLIEYLNYQQYKDTVDQLLEEALEKCDIQYLNPELLKNL